MRGSDGRLLAVTFTEFHTPHPGKQVRWTMLSWKVSNDRRAGDARAQMRLEAGTSPGPQRCSGLCSLNCRLMKHAWMEEDAERSISLLTDEQKSLKNMLPPRLLHLAQVKKRGGRKGAAWRTWLLSYSLSKVQKEALEDRSLLSKSLFPLYCIYFGSKWCVLHLEMLTSAECTEWHSKTSPGVYHFELI